MFGSIKEKRPIPCHFSPTKIYTAGVDLIDFFIFI